MERWHQRIARAAHRLERLGERVQARVTAEPDSAWIEPYLGFGTARHALVRGRVLAGDPVPPARATDRALTNLRSTLRRLESDEIPGAHVRMRFPGGTTDVVADAEGFWEAPVRPDPPFGADRLWHPVRLELLTPVAAPAVTTEVMIPPPGSRFGVISDLDDTVLRTDATRTLRMMRTVFLSNAHTRLPFPGVAAFYRALHEGTARARSPIFYVSSSPWNFHDLLSEFLRLQEIPRGPLFLRDWGVTEREILPTGHAQHKMKAIRRVMESFPTLPFLLIGDSGQEDPEIYHRVVHDFPDRVLAVYIRNVSPAPARAEAIRTLGRETAQAGSDLLLADDTITLARHAADHGWIDPACLPDIADDGGAESSADDPAGADRINRTLSRDAT